MLELLVGGLCAAYCTYVLVESRLLDSIRPRFARVPLAGQVLSCIHCAAFWCSLFTYLLWLGGIYTWWFAWVCAFASLTQLVVLTRWKMEK